MDDDDIPYCIETHYQVDVPEDRRFIGFDGYQKAIDCLGAGDVAIFATYPAFRWVHFTYAIQKGINVFMEKPVTVDGPTTRRMFGLAEEAKKKNLKVAVGLMIRHCRGRQELEQRIRQGEIGEIINVIGANPVRMGLPEVYGGLQTRMVDTVPSSALAAVALQWYTRLEYMAKQNFSVLIGGGIIKREKFNELTEHDQKVVLSASARASKANDAVVRRDDLRAYEALIKRGIVEVDTTPHQAEWDAVMKKARENLAGRVYSKSLLEAAERAAAGQ